MMTNGNVTSGSTSFHTGSGSSLSISSGGSVVTSTLPTGTPAASPSISPISQPSSAMSSGEVKVLVLMICAVLVAHVC